MSPRAKRTAASADAWLIEGPDRTRTEPNERTAEDDFADLAPAPASEDPDARDAGPETRQWLVTPASRPNGAGSPEIRKGRPGMRGKTRPKPRRASEPAKPEAKKQKPAAPQSRRPGGAELEKARELARSQKDEISGLGKRIRELQTELQTHERAARKELAAALKERDALAKRVGRLESQLETARKRGASNPTPKRNRKLNLNGATFEELRGLGLSVTQSARVIAYRDSRGGYASMEELDEVPGLSAKTRGSLRAHLKLQA